MSFFDLRQQKGLFARTKAAKPLPFRKNAVPLHRQKDKRITKKERPEGRKKNKTN